MHTRWLQNRVPSAFKFAKAFLPGYSLYFHKKSVDGSAKCNIIQHDESNVHGVIFDIDENEKPALDRAEGSGYKDMPVTVYSRSEPVQVFTYKALAAYIDNSLLPYNWYKSLVLEGALEHGLPGHYIEKIKEAEVVTDRNQKRNIKANSILRNNQAYSFFFSFLLRSL